MSWTYVVQQNDTGVGAIECQIVSQDSSDEVLSNLGYHSPEGFQIGYGGSGPADLAYSILVDYFVRTLMPNGVIDLAGTKRRVEVLHQQFKRDLVATAKEHFQIDSDFIEEWINNKEIPS